MAQIFIKLLEEGTIVYRPVPASQIKNNIYKVEGQEIYNSDNETWEFVPGNLVVVEKKNLSKGPVLVAVRNAEEEINEI